MLKRIDFFLNRITMYRLVLYVLIALLMAAFVLSAFELLPFTPMALVYTTIFITLLCWIVNELSAWFFDVPTNVESVYITALILALIITPIRTLNLQSFGFLFWISIWAMVSKYILAMNRKHFFNPAALAVAMTALTINQAASWWVGTAWMLPFVLAGGLLITRKVRRFSLVFSFTGAAMATFLGFTVLRGGNLDYLDLIYKITVNSALLFFAFIMLTEPLTLPPTRKLQVLYGIIIGFLFAPQTHIASFYFTPELALLAGNLISFMVSPKHKMLLELKEKTKLAPGLYHFIFSGGQAMNFKPGQYLEWTLNQKHSDSRGNRRYFTIASSPVENEIGIGVRFYQPPSSFKQDLLEMVPGDRMLAGQLAGDFVLPRDKTRKLAFIAGGIGITPFSSMLKDMIDKNEIRPVVMFYSNRHANEIIYADVFEYARENLGIKTVYTITGDKELVPEENLYTKRLDPDIISRELPDFSERTFMISGSQGLVDGMKNMLLGMGISRNKIKTDFFPGLA